MNVTNTTSTAAMSATNSSTSTRSDLNGEAIAESQSVTHPMSKKVDALRRETSKAEEASQVFKDAEQIRVRLIEAGQYFPPTSATWGEFVQSLVDKEGLVYLKHARCGTYFRVRAKYQGMRVQDLKENPQIVKNIDYFETEDDLMQFASQKYSWTGPAGKEFMPSVLGKEGRATRRRRDKEEIGDEATKPKRKVLSSVSNEKSRMIKKTRLERGESKKSGRPNNQLILPDEAEQGLREIGFAPYEGQLLPMIQISPFDICESQPIYYAYIRMINEWENNEAAKLMRLVYFYGGNKEKNQKSDDLALVDVREVKSLSKGYLRIVEKTSERFEKASIDVVRELMLKPDKRIMQFLSSEKEKKTSLSKIPDRIRQDFHKLGFGKGSGGRYWPLIQLSPFEVPRGVRLKYFEVLNRTVKQKKKEILRIVFWLGGDDGDLEEESKSSYSFMKESDIIDYDVVTAQQYGALPKGIANKRDKGTEEFTNEENDTIRSLWKLKEQSTLDSDARACPLLLPQGSNVWKFACQLSS
eukprot:scaffold9067_cov125-Chaetoceros_neogracile.AAC.1